MKLLSILLITSALIAGCSNAETESSKSGTDQREEDVIQPTATTETLSAETAAFSCPHSETRDIYFSSPTLTDSLTLEVAGADCDEATLKMTITTDDGQTIYQHEGRALSFVYDLSGPEGVQYMLENLTSSQLFSPAHIKSGNELPAYADILSNESIFEVNEAAYVNARTNNLPIFCHGGGKTFSYCLAYLDGQAVRLFEAGS